MSHVRWEDLLEEEEQAREPEAPSGSPVPQGPAAPPEQEAALVPELAGLKRPELSLEQVAGEDPELAELLRERRDLEGKMNALLGVEEAPVDERLAKQFPVVEHTPETRIAERRQHERDTARRLLEQKLYARRGVEREEAERVEELRRRRLESGRAQRRIQAREEAKRREQARKAQERVRVAARLAEQVMQVRAGTGGQPRLPVPVPEPRPGLSPVPGAGTRAGARPRLPLARERGSGIQAASGARSALESLARRGREGLELASLDPDALVERGLKLGGMDMDSLMSMEDMDVDGMDMDGMDMDGGTGGGMSTASRSGRGAMDE